MLRLTYMTEANNVNPYGIDFSFNFFQPKGEKTRENSKKQRSAS